MTRCAVATSWHELHDVDLNPTNRWDPGYAVLLAVAKTGTSLELAKQAHRYFLFRNGERNWREHCYGPVANGKKKSEVVDGLRAHLKLPPSPRALAFVGKIIDGVYEMVERELAADMAAVQLKLDNLRKQANAY